MKNYRPKFAFKQRGMTLIELTVVLLILIGLAGLLLPYVGGFLETTKTSSAADSLVEVNKAIDRHDIQFLGYPDDFDDLLDGTSVISWLPGTNTASKLEVLDLTTTSGANAVSSLIKGDIDDLWQMKTGTPVANEFNATFAGTSGQRTINVTKATTEVPLTTNLLRIVPAQVQSIIANGMGLDVDSDDFTAGTEENYYVVFGVGQNTQMAGRTIKEAPVYFGSGGDNPAKAYNRFLAVFKVPLDGSRATYVGALTPELQTLSQITGGYFASTQDDD